MTVVEHFKYQQRVAVNLSSQADRDGDVRVQRKNLAAQRRAFGDALNAAIAASGKSRAQIQAALGVSAPAISNWTAGKRIPEPHLVFALEDFIGCGAGYLSRHLGYTRLNGEQHDKVTAADVEAAIHACDDLDDALLKGEAISNLRRLVDYHRLSMKEESDQ